MTESDYYLHIKTSFSYEIMHAWTSYIVVPIVSCCVYSQCFYFVYRLQLASLISVINWVSYFQFFSGPAEVDRES